MDGTLGQQILIYPSWADEPVDKSQTFPRTVDNIANVVHRASGSQTCGPDGPQRAYGKPLPSHNPLENSSSCSIRPTVLPYDE